MSLLTDLNLLGKDSKAGEVFESLLGKKTFLELSYQKPSEYISIYWEAYLAKNQKSNPKEGDSNLNNLNGKLFELIFSTLLIREKLVPFYTQAKVAFVPNVEYDIVFYSRERGPINISLKTSLRERYKQADLEAFVLKNVHRKALAYLITMEDKGAQQLRSKLEDGDLIGLDNIVYALSPELDELIQTLKEFTFEVPERIEIITSQKLISSKINSVQNRLF